MRLLYSKLVMMLFFFPIFILSMNPSDPSLPFQFKINRKTGKVTQASKRKVKHPYSDSVINFKVPKNKKGSGHREGSTDIVFSIDGSFIPHTIEFDLDSEQKQLRTPDCPPSLAVASSLSDSIVNVESESQESQESQEQMSEVANTNSASVDTSLAKLLINLLEEDKESLSIYDLFPDLASQLPPASNAE